MNNIKGTLVKYGRTVFPWLFRPATHSISGHPEGWPRTKQEFEEFWADKEATDFYFEPSRLAFYEEVLSFVPTKFKKVLDVGCGNGFFLHKLAQRLGTKGEGMVGIDYAESGLVIARKLLPKAIFRQADARQLPVKDKSFDLVIMMETLEHLEHWQQALRETLRALTPGGELVVTIPDGTIDHWVGHTNFWSEDQFRANLAKLGEVVIHRVDDGRTLLGIVKRSKRGAEVARRGRR